MKTVHQFSLTAAVLVVAVLLSSGCATGPKKLTPVTPPPSGTEVVRGAQVIEQPALEPEWADFVKAHYPKWRRHYWVDRGQWGNRGYVFGQPVSPVAPPVTAEITPLPPAPPVVEPPPVIVPVEPPKIEVPEHPTEYTVKKADSLWRIAGKVYGNPLKWPLIYRANKDKVKHPNKIYPGQVLTIPWP